MVMKALIICKAEILSDKSMELFIRSLRLQKFNFCLLSLQEPRCECLICYKIVDIYVVKVLQVWTEKALRMQFPLCEAKILSWASSRFLMRELDLWMHLSQCHILIYMLYPQIIVGYTMDFSPPHPQRVFIRYLQTAIIILFSSDAMCILVTLTSLPQMILVLFTFKLAVMTGYCTDCLCFAASAKFKL